MGIVKFFSVNGFLRKKWLIILAGVVLVCVAILVMRVLPVVSVTQLRLWSQTLGPWFVIVFFLAHMMVTIFPFPRTTFTLAAGILFPAWLAIMLAVSASTCSALFVMVMMRYCGVQLDRWGYHHRAAHINELIVRRGWSIVLGLRFIPVIPFSVINYSAGTTRISLVGYTIATFLGLLPGTAALILMTDVVTGQSQTSFVALSLGTAICGGVIIVYECVMHYRHVHASSLHDPESSKLRLWRS